MATTTLLALKSLFFEQMGERWTGTATGGAAQSFTDTSLINLASESFPTPLVGKQVRFMAGLANNDLRQVVRVDAGEGTCQVNRAFSGNPANTDTYELWGNAIYGGTPLTNLFNRVLRQLRPLTETQVTIVTNQEQYDVSTLVQSRRDIHRVMLRLLDPANLAPYRILDLEWSARDVGGAGTTAVWLTIPAQTLNTAVNELWVRHATGFTAFATDASTVDVVYQDLLVWETLYAFARQQMATTSSDKGRWSALRDWCLEPDHLPAQRGRWFPREPIEIRTFR